MYTDFHSLHSRRKCKDWKSPPFPINLITLPHDTESTDVRKFFLLEPSKILLCTECTTYIKVSHKMDVVVISTE